MRGATRVRCSKTRSTQNFNPRAPCGARPLRLFTFSHSSKISTHAPLAGRDRVALHAVGEALVFQPTRPLRGATLIRLTAAPQNLFQPTRPLRGATQSLGATGNPAAFQPTRPLRGATLAKKFSVSIHTISTHAPLAGRDVNRLRGQPQERDFNPRAPCGARRHNNIKTKVETGISTHAPLAGRDGRARWYTIPKSVFQPTRPLRGATRVNVETMTNQRFQPTRPLRGATEAHRGER